CQPFLQLQPALHPRGTTLRCSHIEVPQVAETYGVMGHSPWWVWGFEHGVNEHGVAIGNHTVFSREPVEEEPGLIGMDLVRLGLERGRSAREALEVIATLLESHGQGGAALAPDAGGYHNSFVLADAREAWHLETSNRRWCARRGQRAVVSNHLAIAYDWEIASRSLESFARDEGWWQGSGRIDVAAAYRNPHVPPRISELRHRCATRLLAEGSGRHDVASLTRILRDHGAGGSIWRDGDATPEEERFFTLCAHSEPVHATTASLVAELPVDPREPWPVGIGFGAPCTGVLLPVYLRGVLPAALARGAAEPDPDSAWWRFRALQDAVLVDPVRHTPLVREGWRPLEERLETDRITAETEALAALGDGDEDGAATLLSAFMDEAVDAALRRAGELRARLS
ncbi:MAG: C69 family dipeptidase, partial [Myxococcota bacterium]